MINIYELRTYGMHNKTTKFISVIEWIKLGFFFVDGFKSQL